MRNAKPVGFIPYKLLDVRFVPLPKEPDYLNSIAEKIKSVAADIYQIRQQTNAIKDYEERMIIREELVADKCPVRSTRAVRSRATPAIPELPEPSEPPADLPGPAIATSDFDMFDPM